MSYREMTFNSLSYTWKSSRRIVTVITTTTAIDHPETGRHEIIFSTTLFYDFVFLFNEEVHNVARFMAASTSFNTLFV